MNYLIALWKNHPIILSYFPLINLTAFIVYAIDKISAQTNAWRVRERTLLLLALIGGSLGALCGMRLFRHKTKKMPFQMWLWLIFCVQVIMTVWIARITN